MAEADGVWEIVRAFLGASAGSALVTAGVNLWQERRRRQGAGTYMAMRLAVVLEAFTSGCADLIIANDNAEQPHGYPMPVWTYRLPTLGDYPDDAEGWKALPSQDANDSLILRNRVAESQSIIRAGTEYHDDGANETIAREAIDRGLEAWNLAATDDAAPARQIMCLAPACAASVFDTWHVLGLRGTGSCDRALEDVFVPEAHIFGVSEQPSAQPGIAYSLPAISTFAWSISVVPLGIAQACLDAFVDLARDRTRLGTSQPLRERETIQSEIGRADGRLRSARGFLRDAMNDLMEAVEREEADLVPVRARLRLAAAHAAETALQVAATVEAATGGIAIFEDCPLARRLRNLRAAVQHVAMSPNNYVVAGRLRLGLDPGMTQI